MKLFTTLLISIIALIMVSCGGNKDLTVANLKEMADAEFSAQKKYSEYYEQALKDSLTNVANLFKALVFSETSHMSNHIKVLKEFGIENYTPKLKAYKKYENTVQNIQSAIEGEANEVAAGYPKVISEAKGFDNALISFNFALDSEIGHCKLLGEMLSNLANTTITDIKYYVCPKCGNIYTSASIKEFCVLCNESKSQFKEF